MLNRTGVSLSVLAWALVWTSLAFAQNDRPQQSVAAKTPKTAATNQKPAPRDLPQQSHQSRRIHGLLAGTLHLGALQQVAQNCGYHHYRD